MVLKLDLLQLILKLKDMQRTFRLRSAVEYSKSSKHDLIFHCFIFMKIGKAFCIRALEDDNDEKLCWGSVLEIRIVPQHNHNIIRKNMLLPSSAFALFFKW